MSQIFRNPVIEWLIMILAVIAGIVAVKFLVSYLPDNGFVGGVKATILSV